MTDTAILEQRLSEAQDALHRLSIGESEVTVRIGEKAVTYSAVKAGELRAYIQELKAQLGQGDGRHAISLVLG
jgi:hypothetical protein